MFRNLFDSESGLMTFLSMLFDLMVLNLLTLLCCIPIVTAGAALAALHQMLIRMTEGRDTYLFKPYFKCFAENFKKSTIAWLLMLAFVCILAVDFWLTSAMPDSQKKIMYVILLVAAFLAALVLIYIFPLQAHYENSIRMTFSNAFRISIGYLPRSILMLAIMIAVPVIFLYFIQYLFPIGLTVGISGVAYIRCRIYMQIFKKLDPPEAGSGEDGEDAADDAAVIESKILERQIPGRDL